MGLVIRASNFVIPNFINCLPLDETDIDTEVLTLSDASVSAFAKAAKAPLNFFRKSRRRGNTILGRAGREPSVVVSSVES